MEGDGVAVLLRLSHVAEDRTIVAGKLVRSGSLRRGAVEVLDDEGVDGRCLASGGAVETAGLSDVDDEGELVWRNKGELSATANAKCWLVALSQIGNGPLLRLTP